MLSVLTSAGCSEFPVMGLAVEQGALLSQDAYALDFGDVPVGHVSDVREVQVLYQSEGHPTPSKLDHFGTGTKAFEVVSSPGNLTPQSCQVVTVGVRFQPGSAGEFEDGLSWTVQTPPHEGSALVRLFGRGTP